MTGLTNPVATVPGNPPSASMAGTVLAMTLDDWLAEHGLQPLHKHLRGSHNQVTHGNRYKTGADGKRRRVRTKAAGQRRRQGIEQARRRERQHRRRKGLVDAKRRAASFADEQVGPATRTGWDRQRPAKNKPSTVRERQAGRKLYRSREEAKRAMERAEAREDRRLRLEDAEQVASIAAAELEMITPIASKSKARNVGGEWDWRESLTPFERRSLARYTSRERGYAPDEVAQILSDRYGRDLSVDEAMDIVIENVRLAHRPGRMRRGIEKSAVTGTLSPQAWLAARGLGSAR